MHFPIHWALHRWDNRYHLLQSVDLYRQGRKHKVPLLRSTHKKRNERVQRLLSCEHIYIHSLGESRDSLLYQQQRVNRLIFLCRWYMMLFFVFHKHIILHFIVSLRPIINHHIAQNYSFVNIRQKARDKAFYGPPYALFYYARENSPRSYLLSISSRVVASWQRTWFVPAP